MQELNSFHPHEIAQEFIRLHGPFAHLHGLTYKFNSAQGVWTLVNTEEMLRDIQAMNKSDYFIEEIKENAKTGEITTKTKHLMMAPKQQDEVARAVLRFKFPDDAAFATGPGLGIAFRNKYVAIIDGKLHVEINKADNYALTFIDVEFDPGAKAPKFQAMLKRLFARDTPDVAEDKVNALKQFYGAALFGFAPTFERCMLLSGGGSNGKSTFQEIMQDALFKGVSKAIAPARWEHEYYLAAIHTIRLNTVSEIPNAEVFASEIFKAVITGDEVQGRHPGERPFQFRPIAGHVFSANELPSTNDVTTGFWRRFLVIDFTQQFDKVVGGNTREDIKGPILREEMSGILNWAIEGAVELIAQGKYTIPASHEEAMKAWKSDADAVISFLDSAAAHEGPDTWTPFRDIYADYCHWTGLTGHGRMSANKLGRRLKSAGLERMEKADSTYYHVRIKDRKYWSNVIGGGEVELIAVPTKESA